MRFSTEMKRRYKEEIIHFLAGLSIDNIHPVKPLNHGINKGTPYAECVFGNSRCQRSLA